MFSNIIRNKLIYCKL